MSDNTEFVTDEEWNKYKHESNGEIDILEMYMSKNMDKMVGDIVTLGMRYLKTIMTIRPINSRQAAAVALVTAATLDSVNLD